MKYLSSVLLLMAVVLTTVSCNRRDRGTENIGGKGGNAVLNVTPAHHGNNIDSCTIYIKYDAQDLPTSFDDSVVCVMTNGKPVASFSQLKNGNYYLTGKGWDPSIVNEVTGGIPFTITEQKEYNITLPVTEKH